MTALFGLFALALPPSTTAAKEPKQLSFPGDMEFAGSVKLLKQGGNVGRDKPFQDRDRVQIKFSNEPDVITCTLRIPKPKAKIDPGGTSPVAIKCAKEFKLEDDKLSFVIFEGGRKVGEGAIRP